MDTVYLSVGATQQRTMGEAPDWRPIDAAPRDGTVIEVRCTYGVAPWYDLFRWDEDPQWGGRWAAVPDGEKSFTPSRDFTWRPYTGDSADYVDPTGGAQQSMQYWRGAVAAKYGLPLDHFEEMAAKNERKNRKDDRSSSGMPPFAILLLLIVAIGLILLAAAASIR